jgi:hypothetical protein
VEWRRIVGSFRRFLVQSWNARHRYGSGARGRTGSLE